MARTRIAVVGSGFGGLEAAYYLRDELGNDAELTVVSDRDEFVFRPNTIYIPFGTPPERFSFPISPALKRRGISFVHARVRDIDPGRKLLLAEERNIPFDYAVLATGAAMRPDELPGLAEHANTIWTREEMVRLRESLAGLVQKARAGGVERKRVLFLIPPNNKCAGPMYEMVMMTDTWLRRQGVRERFDLALATYERGYIQAFGPRLNDAVIKEFADRGIQGERQRVPVAVEAGRVLFSEGEPRPFDLLVAFPAYVAGTRFESLPSDERGFVRVEFGSRQVEGFPDVYAVGDAANFPVKQAFLAFLQADAAAGHITQRVRGEQPSAAFDPVSMCIMEEFDKATFAQVPLRLTGDPTTPVIVDPDRLDEYKVGVGKTWRAGKKMLGVAIPGRFRSGHPFHAGPPWKAMEAGLKVMSSTMAH